MQDAETFIDFQNAAASDATLAEIARVKRLPPHPGTPPKLADEIKELNEAIGLHAANINDYRSERRRIADADFLTNETGDMFSLIESTRIARPTLVESSITLRRQALELAEAQKEALAAAVADTDLACQAALAASKQSLVEAGFGPETTKAGRKGVGRAADSQFEFQAKMYARRTERAYAARIYQYDDGILRWFER